MTLSQKLFVRLHPHDIEREQQCRSSLLLLLLLPPLSPTASSPPAASSSSLVVIVAFFAVVARFSIVKRGILVQFASNSITTLHWFNQCCGKFKVLFHP